MHCELVNTLCRASLPLDLCRYVIWPRMQYTLAKVLFPLEECASYYCMEHSKIIIGSSHQLSHLPCRSFLISYLHVLWRVLSSGKSVEINNYFWICLIPFNSRYFSLSMLKLCYFMHALEFDFFSFVLPHCTYVCAHVCVCVCVLLGLNPGPYACWQVLHNCVTFPALKKFGTGSC